MKEPFLNMFLSAKSERMSESRKINSNLRDIYNHSLHEDVLLLSRSASVMLRTSFFENSLVARVARNSCDGHHQTVEFSDQAGLPARAVDQIVVDGLVQPILDAASPVGHSAAFASCDAAGARLCPDICATSPRHGPHAPVDSSPETADRDRHRDNGQSRKPEH